MVKKTIAILLATLCCLAGCQTRSHEENEPSEASAPVIVIESDSHDEQSRSNAVIPNYASMPDEPQAATQEVPDSCFDEEAIRAEMLEVAEACLPLYREMRRSNIFLPTEGEKKSLLATVAGMGHPSAGENIDMTNYQQVLDFYSLVAAGQKSDIGIYTWNNGLIRTCFYTENGSVYRTHLTLDWSESFEPIVSPVTYTHEDEIFQLTEKGWLFYGEEKPPSGHYAYKSGLRVLPLGEDLRRMTAYLEPLVTYGGNDVLSTSWSDPTEINFNDLFEYLYYYETGTPPDSAFKDAYEFQKPYIKAVPAADFEALIQKYFDISEVKLRELCVYDPERQVYAMMTLMHPLYVPDWEVVSSTQYNDGSIELTVHAVSLSHGRDQVAAHRLRVMPLPDGTFHYLSNTIDYAEVNSDGMRSFPEYSPRITK